jgi:lysozyme
MARNKKKTHKGRKRKLKVPAAAAVAAAALLIAAAVGLLRLRHARPAGETGASLPPVPFQALGIDISHNNEGPVQWDSLRVMVDRSGRTVRDLEKARKVYPVRFVFIKATEGVSMRDPKFKSYWTEAGERDIRRGAYHFFRTSRDGALQARHFIATVGQLRHDDLPPVLDLETIHRGCSYKLLNERALQWLKEVEKHYGRKPIVYTPDSFARDILCDEIKDNYPIWIAHYGVDYPVHRDWTYWQFTDRALVYGMPAPVDLSVMK